MRFGAIAIHSRMVKIVAIQAASASLQAGRESCRLMSRDRSLSGQNSSAHRLAVCSGALRPSEQVQDSSQRENIQKTYHRKEAYKITGNYRYCYIQVDAVREVFSRVYFRRVRQLKNLYTPQTLIVLSSPPLTNVCPSLLRTRQ